MTRAANFRNTLSYHLAPVGLLTEYLVNIDAARRMGRRRWIWRRSVGVHRHLSMLLEVYALHVT